MNKACSLFFWLSLSVLTYSETLYVVKDNPQAAAPYTNWLIAASTIQDAVDGATSGDTILVTNGVYNVGGRTANDALTNRVVIDKAVIVRSVNGPESTIIEGAGPEGDAAIRCVYLGTNAVLAGFTLTNGHTRTSDTYSFDVSGGGAFCEPSAILSNCVATGNRAGFGGGANGGMLYGCVLIGNSVFFHGGGVHGSTLYNCLLTGNSADGSGGGTMFGTLFNCTLTSNSASCGGGAGWDTLYNCIVYYNTAPEKPNFCDGTIMDHSCTTPEASGTCNITNEPLFVDRAAGDLHLLSDSPCVDAGANEEWMANATDLDGNARIGGGVVDIGAYERLSQGVIWVDDDYSEGNAGGHVWLFNAFATITAAVDAVTAGGAIHVAAGTYAGDLNLTKALTIAGSGAVVDGDVTLDSGAVTVSGLTLAPGHAWRVTTNSTIQAAVDIANEGDTILVSDGVYNVGGRIMNGALTNRVVIGKPLTVRSIHGPEVTIIEGGGGDSDTAIRCVYLGANATLIGFTLTNGFTRSDWESADGRGGGVFCEPSAVLSNCVLIGNTASDSGGGVYGGTLYDCELTGNWADFGGGAYSSTLNRCRPCGNSANLGGGAYGGTLNQCTLTGNWAQAGGAANSSVLNKCKLTGNSVTYTGGGAENCTLNNCSVAGNYADTGGGVNGGTAANCTIIDNMAICIGGGVRNCTLNNCIVYYNIAPNGPNVSGSFLNYCCTIPIPNRGANNVITDEPRLADYSHLNPDSPCIGAGSAAYAGGTDMDGDAWANPPSIGCDEYVSGTATGSLGVAIRVSHMNVSVGFTVGLRALIDGHATTSTWSFGDGTVVSNRPFALHAWSSPSNFPVVLTVWNKSNPQGVSATVKVAVVAQPVHYVRPDSPAPQPPYDSWETAATNIQDAVDVSTVPGALVLVTNGVYNAGGRVAAGSLTNRLVIEQPRIVRSVNGPEFTVIEGAEPDGRGVYLVARSALIGFTIANGHARGINSIDTHGGGAYCGPLAVVSNCVLTGSSADYGGGVFGGTLNNCELTGNSAFVDGGGAYGGMVSNCTLMGNYASRNGGGAFGCALESCTVTGNSASLNGGGVSGSPANNCKLTGNGAARFGGGAFSGGLKNCALTGNSAEFGGGTYNSTLFNCAVVGNSASNTGGGTYTGTLVNCILYYNTAPYGTNVSGSTLSYCCLPRDPGGAGNITNEPMFVDYAGGNLRLQSNSPCINTGINQDWMIGSMDLDGNPRIRRNQVDMGAYESDDWGQFSDLDGDGFSDWIEVYRTGTDPTNAASLLGMGTPFYSDSVDTGLVVRWQSANGKTYRLVRTTNLTEEFTSLSNHLNATPPMNVYTDRTVTGQGPWYYRVGVE